MSDLVGNPEDWFSRVAAHIKFMYMMHLKVSIIFIVDIMVLETMSYMPVFQFFWATN